MWTCDFLYLMMKTTSILLYGLPFLILHPTHPFFCMFLFQPNPRFFLLPPLVILASSVTAPDPLFILFLLTTTRQIRCLSRSQNQLPFLLCMRISILSYNLIDNDFSNLKNPICQLLHWTRRHRRPLWSHKNCISFQQQFFSFWKLKK